MKSWSREIRCYNDHIVLKFWQASRQCCCWGVCQILERLEQLNPNLAASRSCVKTSNLLVNRGPESCLILSGAVQLLLLLAATKQLCKWYCPSARLSVCLSVTPFWLCSRHYIIMKFSIVITNDQSKVRAKDQDQRSKVKVTEVTTQLNHSRTVTQVWIHMWWWNDAYRLMLLRKGALLFFKVIRQISRSHGSKNRRIWPRLGVSGL